MGADETDQAQTAVIPTTELESTIDPLEKILNKKKHHKKHTDSADETDQAQTAVIPTTELELPAQTSIVPTVSDSADETDQAQKKKHHKKHPDSADETDQAQKKKPHKKHPDSADETDQAQTTVVP